MLARALAQEPEVLLLDEPTSALDHAARDAIEAALAELRRELEISIVLVSHDPEQARRLSDWVVRLEAGRVVDCGAAGAGARVSVPAAALATSIHVALWQVAASLSLVALAAAISFWRKADLERDIVIATVRSIVQLTLVGYAIKLIFEADTIWLVLVLLAVMVFFGALTARHRAEKVPRSFVPLLIALALAGASTLGLVVALGIFEATPRYLVPVGGMVIGNAMTASAVALNRLGDEMHDSRARIEATLALGATAREAAMPIVRRALRSGMITLVDSTKTTGLIFFPGTMVGMLLAGANPTDAVRLQLILLYTLLGSVSIAALVATGLAYRNFFTPAAAAARAGCRRAIRLTLGHAPGCLDSTGVPPAAPDPDRDDPRLDRRLPRRHRRQRRPAVDQRQPRRRPGRAAVGGRGLHADDGLAAAGRRLARRPVRAAADVRRRPDRLRRHLGPLRDRRPRSSSWSGRAPCRGSPGRCWCRARWRSSPPPSRAPRAARRSGPGPPGPGSRPCSGRPGAAP